MVHGRVVEYQAESDDDRRRKRVDSEMFASQRRSFASDLGLGESVRDSYTGRCPWRRGFGPRAGPGGGAAVPGSHPLFSGKGVKPRNTPSGNPEARVRRMGDQPIRKLVKRLAAGGWRRQEDIVDRASDPDARHIPAQLG